MEFLERGAKEPSVFPGIKGPSSNGKKTIVKSPGDWGRAAPRTGRTSGGLCRKTVSHLPSKGYVADFLKQRQDQAVSGEHPQPEQWAHDEWPKVRED